MSKAIKADVNSWPRKGFRDATGNFGVILTAGALNLQVEHAPGADALCAFADVASAKFTSMDSRAIAALGVVLPTGF